MEGGGEERRVARGDRGAEQRGLRGGGGRLRVAHELGQPRARLLRCSRACSGRRRSPRAAGRSASRRACGRRPLLPDQADAAAERGREIVGVALERQPELEQLVGGGGASGGGDARRRARPRRSRRTSRARARAGSGSRSGSGGPRAARRARTRAARGARRRRGSSSAPSPSSTTSGSPFDGRRDLELVPEVERGRGAVEARAEVRVEAGARTTTVPFTSRPRPGSPRRSARRARPAR